MRVKPIAPLLLALFIGGQLCFAESSINAKYRLHRDLFNETKPHASFLPVEKPTDVLNITFSFDLINIVSVDAKQQSIAVYGFIYQSWVNPRLTWDKTKYGGVDVIYMNPKDLWVPDTYLYYNLEGQDPVTGERASQKTNVAVHSNGTNVWRNHGLFKSICKVEVKYFPLDSQTCELMFGSWTLDSTKLNYIPRRGMMFPTKYHIENGEWSITKVLIGRREVKYQRFDRSFVGIILTIHMSREYLDYFITLIIPCCLISSMIFLGFVLPPESGERVGLSITVLLAMTVFQQLTSELMPSYGMPLLGQYYFCIILEIGASILITTVILNFYHRKDHKMPAWLKTITLGWLAPLVFLKKDTHSYRKADKKMSRRSKKKRASGRRYGSRYQRSIKNTVNDPDDEERGSQVIPGFFFSDSDAMNHDIQDVGHESTFRMNNYSLQFGSVNAREHSGREDDNENQAHDEQTEPSDNEMMMRHWEWSLAGRTLDRIFLVIAICCGIITVCGVFLQAPDVWEGGKALSKDDPQPIFEN